MIKNNVSAVIVTYFPDFFHLKKLIENLNLQVDNIIICDNSPSNLNLSNFLNENIEITNSKIKVLEFNFNLGIAEAQNKGMDWAYANGADFVLHLDQDSMPDKNIVKNLVESYYRLLELGYSVGLLGSTFYDHVTNKLHEKNQLYYSKSIEQTDEFLTNSFLISSGMLIPKSTYKTVGLFESDLFIDLVDLEYCWRVT